MYAHHTPAEAAAALLSLKELLVRADSGAVSAYRVQSARLVPGRQLEFVVAAPAGDDSDEFFYGDVGEEFPDYPIAAEAAAVEAAAGAAAAAVLPLDDSTEAGVDDRLAALQPAMALDGASAWATAAAAGASSAGSAGTEPFTKPFMGAAMPPPAAAAAAAELIRIIISDRGVLEVRSGSGFRPDGAASPARRGARSLRVVSPRGGIGSVQGVVYDIATGGCGESWQMQISNNHQILHSCRLLRLAGTAGHLKLASDPCPPRCPLPLLQTRLPRAAPLPPTSWPAPWCPPAAWMASCMAGPVSARRQAPLSPALAAGPSARSPRAAAAAAAAAAVAAMGAPCQAAAMPQTLHLSRPCPAAPRAATCPTLSTAPLQASLSVQQAAVGAARRRPGSAAPQLARPHRQPRRV